MWLFIITPLNIHLKALPTGQAGSDLEEYLLIYLEKSYLLKSRQVERKLEDILKFGHEITSKGLKSGFLSKVLKLYNIRNS
jgi:hypothetical protein